MPKMASLPETAGPPELPGALHHRRLRRRGVSRQQRRVRRHWRQLYKNRSSRKTDSQQEKRSSGSHILSKIVSENRFSGKTYFMQLVPGRTTRRVTRNRAPPPWHRPWPCPPLGTPSAAGSPPRCPSRTPPASGGVCPSGGSPA